MVDIVTLAAAKAGAKTYTDDAIDRALTSVYKYKGQCTNAQLSSKTKTNGDVWEITDDGAYPKGTDVVCAGGTWTAMAGQIHVDVIDNLASTSPSDALSANMGRTLAESKQDRLPSMTGNAGRVLKVNSTATGVEWAEDLHAKFYLDVTVTASAGTPALDAVTITATPTSGEVVVGSTGADGKCRLEVVQGATYTITGAKAGYYVSSAAATADHTVTSAALTCYVVPTIDVTISTETEHTVAGLTVTASASGQSDVSAVTDTNGRCTLAVSPGTWSVAVTSGVGEGYTAGSAVSVTASAGGEYAAVFTITVKITWTFGMSFNATTFQTDPTGCLEYTDDCTGYTPVSGPWSSTLAKCSTIGDWEMLSDGTSDNPLLNGCFYATFTSQGVLHEKLNPQDLSQKIATWNDTAKEWEAATGASSITTEDTMFCIPTIYLSSSSDKITMSSDPSSGVAYAHTIGGTTYEYLAIGVYETYNNSSVAQSWSGKASTASVTRSNFRTYSTGKTVSGGHAMVWNFHQWNLWRIMTLFAMKSFNGQSQIGQGGFTYSGSTGQGLCNALGPFAGSKSKSASTSTSVKAFIENPWGYKYEFIDDFVTDNGTVWVGQNAVPDDTYDGTNKTSISGFTAQGFPNTIMTSLPGWGLGTNTSGSSSTGLCDHDYINTSGQKLGYVGGDSSSVSSGHAGPSYLYAGDALSYLGPYYGARLAFVFNP